jgi:hypothetical protein
MPIEDTATAASDDHRKIINAAHWISRLAVDILNHTVEYIERVIARLLPSLWESSHDQVLAKCPHPQLIYHEDFRVNVLRFVRFALVTIDDLIPITRLRVDVVVKELI